MKLDDQNIDIRKAFVKRLFHSLVGVFAFFGTLWVAEQATRLLLTITGGN